MARLSKQEIRNKSIIENESYCMEHPKEARRIAIELSKSTIFCSRIAADSLIQQIFPIQYQLPENNN